MKIVSKKTVSLEKMTKSDFADLNLLQEKINIVPSIKKKKLLMFILFFFANKHIFCLTKFFSQIFKKNFW